MKTYMVVLAVDWKEFPNDSYWWRCVKASSEKVAVKRAVERVCKQISFTNDVQAIWAEPLTIQKVIGVLQAFDACEGYTGHFTDMICTIRRNAPELHADAQRRNLDAKIAKLDAERIETFWAAMDCGQLRGTLANQSFIPYEGKEAKAEKLWARLGELLDTLREVKKLRAQYAAE